MNPDKRTDGEKFRSLLSRLVRVPKAELEAEKREYKAQRKAEGHIKNAGRKSRPPNPLPR